MWRPLREVQARTGAHTGAYTSAHTGADDTGANDTGADDTGADTGDDPGAHTGAHAGAHTCSHTGVHTSTNTRMALPSGLDANDVERRRQELQKLGGLPREYNFARRTRQSGTGIEFPRPASCVDRAKKGGQEHASLG